jgi:hypothetical protein
MSEAGMAPYGVTIKPAKAGFFIPEPLVQVQAWAVQHVSDCRVLIETPQMEPLVTEFERGRLHAFRELLNFIEESVKNE